jgi:hypothetical protein
MYRRIEKQNRAGSFTNVATIRDTGDEIIWVEENVNDITVRQENQYKGWLCWAGLESLMITAQGDVYTATCKAKRIGNIYEDFDLPDEPMVCPKDWCACAADLNTTKAKDNESARYLRVNNEQ